MRRDIKEEIVEWLLIITMIIAVLVMIIATVLYLTQPEKKPLTEDQRTIIIVSDE